MNILLVGCGRMGGAMLQGWLKKPEVTAVAVIDPADDAPTPDPRVTFFKEAAIWAAAAPGQPDIVVLAVKPQSMDQVDALLPPLIASGVPVLSIAAGITLTRLARAWGKDRPLIRAMPNTPGAIGQGVTAYIKNDKIDKKHEDTVNYLLSSLGHLYQVFEEIQIDAVTAISGSGPAYVYNFIEHLETAGKNIGLPDNLAAALARETVIGAAALLAHETGTSPAELRKAVTSPGGTTAAALEILTENKAFERLIGRAAEAAFKRSQELAK